MIPSDVGGRESASFASVEATSSSFNSSTLSEQPQPDQQNHHPPYQQQPPQPTQPQQQQQHYHYTDLQQPIQSTPSTSYHQAASAPMSVATSFPPQIYSGHTQSHGHGYEGHGHGYVQTAVAPLSSTPSISSISGWSARQTTDTSAEIPSGQLTIRPPLHTSASWSEAWDRSAGSDAPPSITPDDLPTATHGRAAGSSESSSYFGESQTPTQSSMLSPTQMFTSPFDPHGDARLLGSSAIVSSAAVSVLHRDSSSSGSQTDGRRHKSRAEQNREKMKAYHRRVMQQREALTTILAELVSQIGPLPPSSLATRAGHSAMLSQDFPDTYGTLHGSGGWTDPGPSASSSRGSSDAGWTVSLRNRQKQESKARLRKREIDQVFELGLYADYANAGLVRGARNDEIHGSSLGHLRATGGVAAWSNQGVYDSMETSPQMTEAILRIFRRHRSSWTALISAEQRLAGEVVKLQHGDSGDSAMSDMAEAARLNGGRKTIKALVEHLQLEERSRNHARFARDGTTMGYEAAPSAARALSGTTNFAITSGIEEARLDGGRMSNSGGPSLRYAGPYAPPMHSTMPHGSHLHGALGVQDSPSVGGPSSSTDSDYFSQNRPRTQSHASSLTPSGQVFSSHQPMHSPYANEPDPHSPADYRMTQQLAPGRMYASASVGQGHHQSGGPVSSTSMMGLMATEQQSDPARFSPETARQQHLMQHHQHQQNQRQQDQQQQQPVQQRAYQDQHYAQGHQAHQRQQAYQSIGFDQGYEQQSPSMQSPVYQQQTHQTLPAYMHASQQGQQRMQDETLQRQQASLQGSMQAPTQTTTQQLYRSDAPPPHMPPPS
ncbi:hypothetical protein BCV70DRAFT_202374 [Testicularia cyperi]|uniref:Uncharacterized protein n=1 Tax=Testicularia cyperi TaxID=1882483 RepID=A0A317XKP5_9BASI|nr:hypothetical protein BCV70DRAFT_202374 [Testicularia cyperi]